MPNLQKLSNNKISLKRGNVFVVLLISTLLLTVAFNLGFNSVKAQSQCFKISGYVLDSNGRGIPRAQTRVIELAGLPFASRKGILQNLLIASLLPLNSDIIV